MLRGFLKFLRAKKKNYVIKKTRLLIKLHKSRVLWDMCWTFRSLSLSLSRPMDAESLSYRRLRLSLFSISLEWIDDDLSLDGIERNRRWSLLNGISRRSLLDGISRCLTRWTPRLSLSRRLTSMKNHFTSLSGPELSSPKSKRKVKLCIFPFICESFLICCVGFCLLICLCLCFFRWTDQETKVRQTRQLQLQ